MSYPYSTVYQPCPILNNLRFLSKNTSKRITQSYLWAFEALKGDFDEVKEQLTALNMVKHESHISRILPYSDWKVQIR